MTFIVDAPRVNKDVKCSSNKLFNASWFNCWSDEEHLFVKWRNGRWRPFVNGKSGEGAKRKNKKNK